jgi:GDPmannose 4,6-dehydratase
VRAIVTGARGQDGTLLCNRLRSEGCDVTEVTRKGVGDREPVDLTSREAVDALFERFQPDEVYHLAASHGSSEQPVDIAFEGQMIATNFRIAETMATTIARKFPKTRLLIAGTSKMYDAPPGETREVGERTPMTPSNFYGRTKAWSRELLSHFRERWGVYGCTAILFNHESPLRHPRFVTRKVTMAAARAKRGDLSYLDLMDVHSRTDWSSASDVVEGMRLALRANEPSDYVFASGVARPVTELLDVAFGAVGLPWTQFVRSGRPTEVRAGNVVGDATLARERLGWRPVVDFETMIRRMVEHDLSLGAAERGRQRNLSA